MSKRAWIIFAIICVALLGGLVWLSSKNRIDVSNVDTNAIQPASELSGNIGDQVLGKADSPVILIEYGDFQCPGCAGAHPTIKAVTEKYKDHMAFVFRNFPISNKHPNARAASAAAEAAGLQGKYWEMHNKVFESQLSWQGISANERIDFFAAYAAELELDVERFKTDMTSDAISKKINFDLALGKKAGTEVTPTFFLNGEKLPENATNDETGFETLIVDKLKAAGVDLSDKVTE